MGSGVQGPPSGEGVHQHTAVSPAAAAVNTLESPPLSPSSGVVVLNTLHAS